MGEEAAKQADQEKKEEDPKPPSSFVLYVDLHCVGCAKKIERSILKIKGVEGVVIDMIKNQVSIKGISVDPQAICNKIMKKTKRKAQALSPILPPQPAQPDEAQPLVVSQQVSEPISVELNVNMHCEACAEQLKRKILQMRGVEKAVTELSTGKVIVTGTMDGEKLVEYVYRRTRKQARIVPQPAPEPEPEPQPKPEPEPEPEPEKKEEEKPAEEKGPGAEEAKNEEQESKKEENNSEIILGSSIELEENMKSMMMHYNYQLPLHMIQSIPPPPQLFSDENPNACSIS
ncbi:Heavy metal transport/detoxification superfamily protein [Euphorbia peplus]|nr:Heavy metal transport/detoxification superfamily protein [Euphorbia peplus]